MSSSQNVRRENPSAPGVVSLPEPAVGSGTTPASTTAPPRQQHKPGNKLAKKKKTPKAP
ncbi:hypothetical protein AGABI2DRAFT_132565, partial [Agaricus bisporus var. bisporus H97]|uniref:hypothetical protein n=1 Tax=Agaricus bisporus var. bisporus (strain H97 / ATCC MYA-4626 / FGSC 10389) TaxID=936046 RepID=UPI00029F67A7